MWFCFICFMLLRLYMMKQPFDEITESYETFHLASFGYGPAIRSLTVLSHVNSILFPTLICYAKAS